MCPGHEPPAPETLSMGVILQGGSASSPAGDSLSALLSQLFGSFMSFCAKDRGRRKCLIGYSLAVVQKYKCSIFSLKREKAHCCFIT